VSLQGEGIVEARVAALMENLAVAVMQANNLAADSPEYEALAETVAYALDLAELGLSVESKPFDALEPPKTRCPRKQRYLEELEANSQPPTTSDRQHRATLLALCTPVRCSMVC
jgi:hypothetical protein